MIDPTPAWLANISARTEPLIDAANQLKQIRSTDSQGRRMLFKNSSEAEIDSNGVHNGAEPAIDQSKGKPSIEFVPTKKK